MKQYFENMLEKIIFSTEQYSDVSSDCFTTTNITHYPEYLYKYRSCNKDFNFQMLEDEYLWADIPANFVDPSDSLVNLKLKSELPIIQKWLWEHLGELLYYSIPPKGMPPHKNGQTLKNYISAQGKFTDSVGRYNAQRAKSVMLLETKKFQPNQRKEIQKVYEKFESPEFETQMQKAIENTLTNVVNSLRNKNLVCSLTARKDNKKMWEEYADKYEGFVIEYNIAKATPQSDKCSLLSNIFPVTYYKRFPKVPLLPFIEQAFYKDLYGKSKNITPTLKCLYKQPLCKQYDYRAEEEWRILATKNKIPFPFLSAVYAGYKISDNNLNKLKAICINKSIALYKQSFNSFDGNMIFDKIV